MTIVPIYLSLVLHCLVLIDLYLTLKNPFYPKRKRASVYYAATLLCLLFIGLLAFLETSQASQGSYALNRIFMSLTILLMVSMLVLYFAIIGRMIRKGTSRDLRGMIIRRYIIYFLLYQVIAFSMLNDQSLAVGFGLNQGLLGLFVSSKATERVFKLIFCSTGIFLAFILLIEPFVLKEFMALIRHTLHRCNCRKKEKPAEVSLDKFLVTPALGKKREKKKYGNEPLTAFVNSAMNIELVYLILIGINNFMEQDSYG
mmetsp:Transcript_24288/g.37485  ORF Transcript_24288/g.37485 Transcript_24288/m.37485 type:complete len:257 (+) Transcript_24288:596-1366(+)